MSGCVTFHEMITCFFLEYDEDLGGSPKSWSMFKSLSLVWFSLSVIFHGDSLFPDNYLMPTQHTDIRRGRIYSLRRGRIYLDVVGYDMHLGSWGSQWAWRGIVGQCSDPDHWYTTLWHMTLELSGKRFGSVPDVAPSEKSTCFSFWPKFPELWLKIEKSL